MAADENPTDDTFTGLPGLKTWPRVYGFVLAAFAIIVALLTWFTGAFS